MMNLETLTQMNKVDGFNPLDFARTLTTENGSTTSLYLDVRYRIVWFRLKYPEGKIRKMIHSLNDKAAVVECFIYKDSNNQPDDYLANGFGQHFYDASDIYGSSYLECAETTAIGRALAAAGFNISVGNNEGDELNPVDAGLQTSPDSNGIANQQDQVKQEQHKSQTNVQDSVTSYTQDTSVEDIMKVMTLDAAKAVVVPFGKCIGKTLAELAHEDTNSLNWITTKYIGPNNILKAAAKLLIEKSTKNAA